MNYKYFFTVTAGRTGTAWLTSFIETNLNIKSVHEPLGIDDFGTRMPDIKLMRTFNERGNTQEIQSFYTQKLDEISLMPAYSETNHTLAKCGLVENLARHPIAHETCLIVLRRDFASQCVSYLNRGDFRNITIVWQWYLHQNYHNNIIGYKPFEKFGFLGLALWYVYEMDARQHYYTRCYADKIKIILASLEEITTESGASDFLSLIGHLDGFSLPEAKNQSIPSKSNELLNKVKQIISSLNYDPDLILDRYISEGRRLSTRIPG